MGTLQKIGNDYYIEFTARGLRYQRNGGPNKAIAQRLLEDIEDKIQKGELKTIVADVETSTFLKTFLEKARAEHSPKTFSRYQSVVWHFQEFCRTSLSENSKLSRITPSIIEEYRVFLLKESGPNHQPVKPKFVNFTLYLLKDILDYAITLGYLNDNPTRHTRFVEVPDQKIPQALGEEEIKNLLMQAPATLKDIILFLVGTGIHLEELIGLQWRDIDFKENCFKIKQVDGSRRIPLDAETLGILQRLKDKNIHHYEYVFYDTVGQPLKKRQTASDCAWLAEQIGLKGSGIFSIFRHTFARKVLNKGVSLVGLSKLLGLTDIARVMRYAGFVPGNY